MNKTGQELQDIMDAINIHNKYIKDNNDEIKQLQRTNAGKIMSVRMLIGRANALVEQQINSNEEAGS